MRRSRSTSLLLLVLLAAPATRTLAGTASCTLDYDLPADIPVPTSEATNDTFQQLSWLTFLALSAPTVGGSINASGDNVPQWASWSSTVDLLLCQESPTPGGCLCPDGDCAESGTHYYPSVCQDLPNYQNYRVIGQVGKIDDSFEEAATGGLSGDPVIDRFGGFLRYEILISPATYDDVIEKRLYDEDHLMSLTTDVNLDCGTSSYTGGDPADPDMGAIVVKLAWMDVTDPLQRGEIDASMYHLQQTLLYVPDYRNDSGVATCDLRTMALVGMHVAHKTVNQPNWIWSTFEHERNAPDCTDVIPGAGTPEPNTSCPTSVDTDFHFYGEVCNDADEACADCNAAPAANGDCENPDTSVGTGYCLDEAPAASGGLSKVCRQVPVSEYPEATAWNDACHAAIGDESVWGHYGLVSGQWGTSAFAAGCENVASQISGSGFTGPINDSVLLPRVPAGTGTKPFLGNSSMESYDRSNCLGCHSKANFTNDEGTALSTDLIYFLQLQVSAPAATRPGFVEDLAPPSTGGEDDSCQIVSPRPGKAWWMLGALAILALRRVRRPGRRAGGRMGSLRR